MTIVATLKDGRVISKETLDSTKDRVDAGKLYITATFPDLKQVEQALQFHLSVDPNVNATTELPIISGNVVGVTVYCGAGTTISDTSEAIAIGPGI